MNVTEASLYMHKGSKSLFQLITVAFRTEPKWRMSGKHSVGKAKEIDEISSIQLNNSVHITVNVYSRIGTCTRLHQMVHDMTSKFLLEQ